MVTAVDTLSLPRRKPMTPLLAAILGGIVLFAWSSISWMALPWHMATLHSFRDDKAVMDAIKANAPQSGIYVMPIGDTPENQQRMMDGPQVFSSVRLGPLGSMGPLMARQWLIQVVAALIAALLLQMAGPMTYGRRVLFLVGIAAVVAVAGHLPQWNWWSFSTAFTLAEIADLLIGWTLAGLVMARIVR